MLQNRRILSQLSVIHFCIKLEKKRWSPNHEWYWQFNFQTRISHHLPGPCLVSLIETPSRPENLSFNSVSIVNTSTCIIHRFLLLYYFPWKIMNLHLLEFLPLSRMYFYFNFNREVTVQNSLYCCGYTVGLSWLDLVHFNLITHIIS